MLPTARLHLFPAVTLVAVLLLLLPGAPVAPLSASTADHLMCGWRVEQRPQTVSIDPDLSAASVTYDDVTAAFSSWNSLYLEYYGFPMFVPFDGPWADADILITAHGGSRTWVDGQCDAGYRQRGDNQSIVFLGSDDTWRNRTMLPHELGHTLGFADEGPSSEYSPGHIGYKPCGDYIGVMSYCTSPQSWFLDYDLSDRGIVLDGQLVRDYWQP